MDIHTLKNLLCLSEKEKQYLTETFENENLSYFYRTFKKLYGMTPRQYRKLHEA